MLATSPFAEYRRNWITRSLVVLGLSLVWVAATRAQLQPDQAAAMLLDRARKAYNDHNYPQAVAWFREYLGKYGGSKDAPAARYGLALALLEMPEKDYQGAAEQLQPLTNNKEFADRAYALYYLGLAQRGLGVRELPQAVAKPQEANQRRGTAHQRFEEAGKQFAAAWTAFTERTKPPAADADKGLPIELEWAARARCDLAEMQLRTRKTKEAQDTVGLFLEDPFWCRSRYRALGLYYHGLASFLLQDYLTAGRSLNMLTPFSDPVFGTHAHYLLARTHHLADERGEAALHYEAVLTDYDKQKKAAIEALKRPDQFKNDPGERARLEALVKDPPPDHVSQASFFWGVLLYEAGRFGDAMPRFANFGQQFPGSPLIVEAQLRHGFCQVQLRQFPEALKTLQPLVEKEPRLADQALFWIGKAQAGAGDPNNPQAYDQALKTAIDTLRRAAERAQQLASADPTAKERRGEILLELADTQQLARQYKEAANTYNQLRNEKLLPTREEEILERQVAALHLAGDYNGSDELCQRFVQTYPKSTLLGAVRFRFAENAYFRAATAEKNPNLPNRAQELTRLYDEVAKRYQLVVDRFPELQFVHQARYSLAMAHYRNGEIEKAQEILEAIPAPERNGGLAVVSYALADCLLRLAPVKADDALAAGQLQERIQAAIELLETFIASQPTGPQVPDALLKLGLCHQRLATVTAQPQERAKVLASARSAYERLIQQFVNHELRPQAGFERAKVLAQAGDIGGAINELQRFRQDPLKNTNVAPMAVLELATLLRNQKKANEAADALAQCRQQNEGNLQKDPERAAWVPLLRYHQGVALQECGKLAEARGIFDQVVKQSGNRPEGPEAAIRGGQCLREEGGLKITAAQKTLASPNLKPEEQANAHRLREEGVKMVRDAAQYLEGQLAALKAKQPGSEALARMYYELAWEYRTVADHEVAMARAKIQQEQLKKLQDEAQKKVPKGEPPAIIGPPEVPLNAVPEQPAEKKAKAQYQAIIDGFTDLPLATEARFELAELYLMRTDFDGALKLLNEGLDREPPAELTDKIRLRLGENYLAKGDMENALNQFNLVAGNPKSPLAGHAHYRSGECLMQMKDWTKAAARLAIFRDPQPFQNLPGVSDRALLRLGHALAYAGQWDQSRQALETLVGRFGHSPWIHEARYGIGWAWQNQKQYDNAVNAYSQVVTNTATETAAKAQLQIGLCRLEQKRYPEAATALLVVPYTYDYPEWSAVALCEAARTFVELKQRDQAAKLLQRVIQDHPKSKWAEVAKERLEALRDG
jgi:TolA-binding protein